MTTPRVTVIVPTHDRPRFLREALASIFGQTFENFELIVVDDGSTDETQEVLARVGDPRMRVIRQQHRGIGASLNSGLAAAERLASPRIGHNPSVNAYFRTSVER